MPEILVDYSLLIISILCIIAFAAGFIDAVAGGGGMLVLPALMIAGVPPASSLAVNKMTGMAGTTLAVLKYTLDKHIHWRTVFLVAIPCLLASYIGGLTALSLPPSLLTWAILFCIPVALFIVLNDKHNTNKKISQSSPLKSISALAPIGFYDGLLGPGTGTYMAIAVRKILHYDYLHATATIKPLNLLTNIGAAIAFIIAGKVIWLLAIPMLLSSALGGWLGSHTAIKGGNVFIRRALIVVLIIMLMINIIRII